MLAKTAYGLVMLTTLAGCQTMKDLRPSWAANNSVEKNAEPAFQQYAANASAEAAAENDVATLTAATNRIDEAAASAASGSPQTYSKSEPDISSYPSSSAARRFQSSTCRSGCCSN